MTEETDTIRVLCIDDYPDMIMLMKDILTKYGYHVIGALSGKEGLEKMRTEKPDVILLDLMMPEVEGWEVYRQMKRDTELREIPVIIVTAKGDKMEETIAREIAKVDDFIRKPFDVHTLVDRVREVLKER
jgi:DNA-binding response OmpR family regulator